VGLFGACVLSGLPQTSNEALYGSSEINVHVRHTSFIDKSMRSQMIYYPSRKGRRKPEEGDLGENKMEDCSLKYLKKKLKKLRGLSPQANYTDRATAAC
jgi:hypothetical protein